MHKTVLHTLLVCLFAFLGGVFSDQFLNVRDSHAAGIVPDLLAGERPNMGELYTDNMRRKRISLNASEGPPIQEFYGIEGNSRLQIGTFAGDEASSGDAGLPLITLKDRNGQLRLLFRIAQGKNQSPVMVMKDSKGNDRIVMGLAVNADGEEPFMAYFDKSGGRRMVFGNY